MYIAGGKIYQQRWKKKVRDHALFALDKSMGGSVYCFYLVFSCFALGYWLVWVFRIGWD